MILCCGDHLLRRQATFCLIADSTDGDLLALTGTGVGLGPLAVARQIAPMTHAAIAVDLLQTTNVRSDHAAKFAFHNHVILQHAVDRTDLFAGEFLRFDVAVDVQFFNDLQRFCRADAVDLTERILDPLVAGDVNTDDTRHRIPVLILKID